MSPAVALPLAIVAAYLVGSIDFAVIVGRMYGVDIHQEGSGNPGMSNVLRTMGRVPAAMVFIGDTLKGTIGAAMGWVASGSPDPAVHWAFLAGLAAVVGHCYPIFHRFKGGKGVATGGGVLLFTVPIVAVIEIATWFLIFWLTKTASIGSMVIVVITVPLLIWQGVTGLSLVWVALIIALVVWRHRGNIKRMVSGSEEKVPT
ncbi:MAG TPA: glycerol-3-phosphate 1-O-acyltransferase PlsY [Acidimicrobiia bacterium]|jgi:glycerol-3-phosphate acyltransferase PlsY|nr:glycerol-3-phosphate acyltransferase [Acidimicrobiia bacterium]HYJ24750.1 glycerol-3-phosphate 1-O-acyltransferase PlsY [Acidimicrobiia bacterium]